MPITPDAASMPDIRPDFFELHPEPAYQSRYGTTTRFHSPDTGQQVIHHVHKQDLTPTCEGGYGLASVLSPQPGAHVVINVIGCPPPEEGFLEDLEAHCGPGITYTLITEKRQREDAWLREEATRLSIFSALLDDTNLTHVIGADLINPWAAEEQGFALATITGDLTGSAYMLNEHFDGRVAEGFAQIWEAEEGETVDKLDRLRDLAQPVQWALEGIIREGTIGDADHELLHRQIRDIEAAVKQLLGALDTTAARESQVS
jgi:hypothetical protein